MAGKRGRAGEDLRTDSGRERTAGIKPGLLQNLFGGGVAKGGPGDSDLRAGRNAARPGEGRMLFAGGKFRSMATEDLRMGAPGEGSDKPQNMEMLAEGGEVDDEGGGAHSAEEKLAAHEAMAAIKSGNAGAFLNAIKGLFMLLGG